jgi:hypothetical protein
LPKSRPTGVGRVDACFGRFKEIRDGFHRSVQIIEVNPLRDTGQICVTSYVACVPKCLPSVVNLVKLMDHLLNRVQIVGRRRWPKGFD